MRHCRFVSHEMTLARINRVVSAVKVQFAESVVLARRRREAVERGVDEDRTVSVDDRLYYEQGESMHSPERQILFREFVEAIIRVATAVYENSTRYTTLPEKFGAALDQRVKKCLRIMNDFPSDDVPEALTAAL